MRMLHPVILLVALLALTTVPGWALETATPSGSISITADSVSHESGSDSFTASGNVEIRWMGTLLNADKAVFDGKTRDVTATGKVKVIKGEDVLSGETVTINVDTGRGELDKAVVIIPESNVTFTGDKVIRQSETEFTITNTELTTCDIPDPSWKFKADELKVNILGYATGKNVVFYARQTPVMYLPWIAFPVVRERKSGLLFPRFGYSNTRGAQLDLPLYWVISPSQDLLADLDIQTKRGVGTGADYRYIRTRGSEGSMGGYLIYDALQSRWRGQLGQTHKEIFSRDLNLRTFVNINSDRTFLSDFGEKSGDYNRQTADTIVNGLKTWDNYALTLHLRRIEDLYASDNSATLQTLPEVGLAAVRQKLFTAPLYFDLDSTASNLYRDTGTTGQRLQAFPRLTLTGRANGQLNLSAYAGLHLLGYATDNAPAGSSTSQRDGDLQPEVGAAISTSLSRVYTLDTPSLSKLRHELVPEISYRYGPERDQTRLPFYDYTDRFLWQNQLTVALSSYLGGRFVNGTETSYRELSRIRLSQGYSFEGERRDLLTMVDTGRHLTDLMLESETWLHRKARLTFDARYNFYDQRISSAAPGFEFDDAQGTAVGLNYRMSRNQVEYLEGHISTRLYKPWTFGYTARYSFDRGDFLESVYSAEYKHKCWSIVMALRDRPGSQSFSFNLNLAGLTGK